MDYSQNKNAVGRAEKRSAPCHTFNRAIVLTCDVTLVAQYSVSHGAKIVFSWSPLHPTARRWGMRWPMKEIETSLWCVFSCKVMAYDISTS